MSRPLDSFLKKVYEKCNLKVRVPKRSLKEQRNPIQDRFSILNESSDECENVFVKSGVVQNKIRSDSFIVESASNVFTMKFQKIQEIGRAHV